MPSTILGFAPKKLSSMHLFVVEITYTLIGYKGSLSILIVFKLIFCSLSKIIISSTTKTTPNIYSWHKGPC